MTRRATPRLIDPVALSEVDSTITRGPVSLPLPRGRVLTAAVLWAAGAGLLLHVASLIYMSLDFRSTGVDSVLVDISIALLALPIPVLGIVCAIKALTHLVTAVWPGRVGVFATPSELTLAMGPRGARTYDVERLTVQYPFELEDEERGTYEAYLPPEKQFVTILPTITHPDAREPINKTMLNFLGGTEEDLAVAFRPIVAVWRDERPGDEDEN